MRDTEAEAVLVLACGVLVIAASVWACLRFL